MPPAFLAIVVDEVVMARQLLRSTCCEFPAELGQDLAGDFMKPGDIVIDVLSERGKSRHVDDMAVAAVTKYKVP